MKVPENRSEERSRQLMARRRIGRLEHLERRRRDDQSEHDHPAQPHDQRQKGGVTDDEHPLIIIAGLPADLDRLAADVLRVLTDGAAATPDALSFLLRRYGASGRADVRDALEPALATALNQPFATLPPRDRAAWLPVFVDAAALVDDARVPAAVASLTESLRDDFAAVTRVDDAAAIVDARLAAAAVMDPHAIVPDAIDDLERIVGAAYRPGDGLVHDLRTLDGPRGGFGDHVRAASALLTAYHVTARIPYAMLAEELMQVSRRTSWDEEAAVFTAAALTADEGFAANCAAARVWCRLASLHAEDEYRAAAVVAPDAVYLADAGRILASPVLASAVHGLACATYGLALGEWLGL
jgi:hypothetical protein